jgi:hypothetical protein
LASKQHPPFLLPYRATGIDLGWIEYMFAVVDVIVQLPEQLFQYLYLFEVFHGEVSPASSQYTSENGFTPDRH